MPELPTLPTGTVTFLFTDLEGSTRQNDPEAMKSTAVLILPEYLH